MEMHQEPMMLGSPVATSPSNTSLHHNSASQYLPGFLMGDHTVSNPMPVSPRSSSGPTQTPFGQHYSNFSTYSPKTSPPKTKFGSATHSRFDSSSIMANPRNDSEKDKPGAPPVSALINESNSSYSSPAFGTPRGIMNVKKYGTPLGVLQTAEPRKILGSTSNFASPPSPLQNLSQVGVALPSGCNETEMWVTVFGFPPATSSYILQQFSRCGNIMEHHQAPDGGNWMHIKFESKLQAKKALLKSGKIFSGNIMIGVNPCKDPNVAQSTNQENLNASSIMSPLSHNVSNTRMSAFNSSRVNSPKPLTVRAVSSAYCANSSELKVFNETQTPQKSNGIVTKTWDYLFG